MCCTRWELFPKHAVAYLKYLSAQEFFGRVHEQRGPGITTDYLADSGEQVNTAHYY